MQKCMGKNKRECDSIMNLEGKVALVTGGAKRIGASIINTLHKAGMTVVIHYHSSDNAARELQESLLDKRENSAMVLQGDLADLAILNTLVPQTIKLTGRLDLLVNNASIFYPTPLESANEQQWQELMATNLKAPFFLTQAAAKYLKQSEGNVINIVDIYADRPLQDHPIYAASKAGLVSLTKSFAQSLGPEVRVNGISPGAILWPEDSSNETLQQQLLSKIPLKSLGDPQDIANTVVFLIADNNYINGHIINIDGGRTVIP